MSKGLKDLSILVVDDEPDLGELVAFEFELLGARVQNSLNGREALEKIKSRNFDVVVSDIRMPGGDGVELLDRLRAHNLKMPALAFMTGYADITAEEAYHKGAIAMFGKPFNRKDLINTVATAVLPYRERWPMPSLPANGIPPLEGSFPSALDASNNNQLRFGHGGFFFSTTEKTANVNDRVRFLFHFADEPFKTVSGEGIVRWIRRQQIGNHPPGMGVEFAAIDEPYRDAFFEFIDKLSIPSFIPK